MALIISRKESRDAQINAAVPLIIVDILTATNCHLQ